MPIDQVPRTAQEGNIFLWDVSTRYYCSDNLLKAFDSADNRKASWIMLNYYNGQFYSTPYKYKSDFSRSLSASREYTMMIRYAEMYLIRAEARASQSKISEAQEDVNVIRSRAGLPNTIASNKNALLDAIAQENRIEFFSEWGHRWFDLKRANTVDQVLQSVKSGYQS